MSPESVRCEADRLEHGLFSMRNEADEAAFLAGLEDFIGPEGPDDEVS